MAFTEFYCNASTGSNLNGGSGSGSPTATDAAATYGRDTGAGGLDLITASSGTPFSGVSVGEFVGVKAAGGSAPADFVCRVTAVNSGGASIDVSDAAAFGTRPANSTSVDVYVGGVWKGPDGASGFPFPTMAGVATDASGNKPRVNLKSGTSYSISSAIAPNVAGPVLYQGYTTTVGDGGKAVIDGSTNAITAIAVGSSGTGVTVADLDIQSSATTGSSAQITGQATTVVYRCKLSGGRGAGITTALAAILCEITDFNKSATSNVGALGHAGLGAPIFMFANYIHDATGSTNKSGIVGYSGSMVAAHNVIDTVGGDGIRFVGPGFAHAHTACNNDIFNCGSDGIEITNSVTSAYTIMNNNFVDNAGYGINISSGSHSGIAQGNRFGAGTRENTSGTFNTLSGLLDIDNSSYASDVTPWTDPDNGNFTINLAAAKGASSPGALPAGIGTMYQDIGAIQHQDAGGGGSTFPSAGLQSLESGVCA